MNVEIRSVTTENIKDFSSVILEAAQWLRETEKEMWRPDEVTPEVLLRRNSLEELYIAYLHEEPIGTIILQEKDDIFWPGDEKNDSLYLHKLAVRRKFAGKGISQKLMSWAKEETLKRGKKYLKLDCAADRPQLCSYYQHQGFQQIEEKQVEGMQIALFTWQREK